MGNIKDSMSQIMKNKNNGKYVIELVKERLKKCKYKLYKYCSIENNYSFENLENDTLYFNSLETFNDPFESVLKCTDLFINLALIDTINDVPEAKKVFNDISYIASNFRDKISNKENQKNNNDLLDELVNYLNKSPITSHINATKEDVRSMLELTNNKNLESGDFEKLLSNFKSNTQKNIDIKIYKNKIDTIKTEIPKTIRNNLSANFKITCFSEISNDILMWSHYASKHQGFVIEYDLNDIFKSKEMITNHLEVLLTLFKVDYIKELPEVPILLLQKKQLSKEELGTVFETLYQKNKCWKYEKEWRSIIRRDNNSTISFIKASRVIVGVNASQKTIDRLKAICEQKKIIIKQYSIDPKSYSLKFKKII